MKAVKICLVKITKVVLIHCYIVNNSYQTKFKSLVYICS